MKSYPRSSVALVSLVLLTVQALPSAFAEAPRGLTGNEPADEPVEIDRSPIDLALSPDGKYLVTANRTADSVSLISVAERRVVDELSVGRKPTAVAFTPESKRVLVSCMYSGEIYVLDFADNNLSLAGVIEVGFHPYGVAVLPDQPIAFVALSASGEVAVIDFEAKEILDRIAVGVWPRHLALTPDGKRLAVGTAGDGAVSVIDTKSREVLFKNHIYGLNFGQMQVSADGAHVYFPWMLYRDNPITVGNIRNGWVLGSRIARMRLDKWTRRDAIALDPSGQAVGDPQSLALTPDGQWALIAVSGTGELLALKADELPYFTDGGPDRMDGRLARDGKRFFRVKLGGRPTAVRAAADNRTVYVANYLKNNVQIVDLQSRELVGAVELGGPGHPSLARRGEAIFYDAGRSIDGWYSCHSCHFDGSTNAEPFDTWNDRTSFTYKTVTPLYHVSATGPWTWHGWQESLDDGLEKSLTTTMQGPKPPAEDVAALRAFVDSLEPPPNPFRLADGSLSEAAKRGQVIFANADANCASCHTGEYFTDGEIHDVGTGRPNDEYEGYNTPSLIGLYQKTRFLHDGRARSLEKLLTGPHSPVKVSGTRELTADEIADLITYLRSL